MRVGVRTPGRRAGMCYAVQFRKIAKCIFLVILEPGNM